MIITLIILVIICGFLIYKLSQKKSIDKGIEEYNNTLKIERAKIQEEYNNLSYNIELQRNQFQENQNINNELENKINSNRIILQNTIEQNQAISNNAFDNYWNALENKYTELENDFDVRVSALNDELLATQSDLDKLKATRAAAHEALLKEQEIKDNKDDYRLIPSESDLADSRKLEIVKRELNKPRIICMLIWQTYWQPLAKKQFPLILQAKTKTGIYKITNQITDECYIGQAVDVYKRWCEHCKCGLGIDTPPGNKLYKAIQEYGLDNFTFELIEECDTLELNEKERYFIDLYQADTFGYNGNKGVK